MPSDQDAGMAINFALLYGMDIARVQRERVIRGIGTVRGFEYARKNGRADEERVDELLHKLSDPHRVDRTPYAAIQAAIPCTICPSEACRHGAMSQADSTVRSDGFKREYLGTFARSPWSEEFEREHLDVFVQGYITAPPVRVPDIPVRPAPAPPSDTGLLRKAVGQYARVYENQWERLLDESPDDRIVEIAKVVAAARTRLVRPQGWWSGRECAVGPNGPVDSTDPKAMRWSITGALYAGMHDDPVVSEAVRSALILVAVSAIDRVPLTWVEADQRLTRWNAEPGRTHSQTVDVLRRVNDVLADMT